MRKPILSSVLAGAIVSILSAAFTIEVREEPTGYELWGMRPKHPAVVNPALGSDPAVTLDLGGDWEFAHHTKYVPERAAFWGVFPTAVNWGATKTAPQTPVRPRAPEPRPRGEPSARPRAVARGRASPPVRPEGVVVVDT